MKYFEAFDSIIKLCELKLKVYGPYDLSDNSFRICNEALSDLKELSIITNHNAKDPELEVENLSFIKLIEKRL